MRARIVYDYGDGWHCAALKRLGKMAQSPLWFCGGVDLVFSLSMKSGSATCDEYAWAGVSGKAVV